MNAKRLKSTVEKHHIIQHFPNPYSHQWRTLSWKTNDDIVIIFLKKLRKNGQKWPKHNFSRLLALANFLSDASKADRIQTSNS